MINGIWTALPNTGMWAKNSEILKRTVAKLFEDGISGLFILGTTGQGADETVANRIKITQEIVEAAGDASRIITAVSANAPQDVKELIRHSQSLGVQGVAFTPPSYGWYSDQELQSWLEKVLIGESPSSEYYLYNFPAAVSNRWSVQLAEFAAQLAPIAGVKDSSGSAQQLSAYLEWTSKNGASMMVGDERLGLHSLMMGGSGIVSGLSAAYPALLSRLYAAAVRQDWDTGISLQQEVNDRLDELSKMANSPRESVRILIEWMRQNAIMA